MSMTAGTVEYPFRQGQRMPMSTDAAGLRCVGRIDLDQLAASFCRFARQLRKECRPRGICNAFSETMGMHHAADGQILDGNDAKAIDDLSTLLVGEVPPPPGNAFMRPRYGLAVLVPFWRSLGKFAVLALHFCQGLLFLAEKAWVGNLFPSREGGKGLESHI